MPCSTRQSLVLQLNTLFELIPRADIKWVGEINTKGNEEDERKEHTDYTNHAEFISDIVATKYVNVGEYTDASTAPNYDGFTYYCYMYHLDNDASRYGAPIPSIEWDAVIGIDIRDEKYW